MNPNGDNRLWPRALSGCMLIGNAHPGMRAGRSVGKKGRETPGFPEDDAAIAGLFRQSVPLPQDRVWQIFLAAVFPKKSAAGH